MHTIQEITLKEFYPQLVSEIAPEFRYRIKIGNNDKCLAAFNDRELALRVVDLLKKSYSLENLAPGTEFEYNGHHYLVITNHASTNKGVVHCLSMTTFVTTFLEKTIGCFIKE